MSNRKILILFAHPRSEQSEANSLLAHKASKIENVTFVDLYAEYPKLDINVDLEQERLKENDVIVFQHPVYWYSSPSILKEWQDLVLEYNFAYGTKGTALRGKIFFNAVTCGARRETYCNVGHNGCELRDLFLPFEQTAKLCKMTYLPPFVLYGAGHAKDENRMNQHIEDYETLLKSLSNHRFNIEKAKNEQSLSKDLNSLLLDKREVSDGLS